ncbi:MAG: hypothetical protein AAGC95_16760 [Pseudomonadota bacterium]
MRFLAAAAFAAITALAPFHAFAETGARAGGVVEIEADGRKSVMAAGGRVVVSGNVENNVRLAGGSISVSGSIGGDLAAAGGDVGVTEADIVGDVMIMSGDAALSADVGGDVQIIAADIDIAAEATVAGDVNLAGAAITMAAEVAGDFKADGAAVTLTGAVAGDADISSDYVFVNSAIAGDVKIVAEEIEIGPNAEIAGDLNYSATARAKISPQAEIEGDVNYTEVTPEELDTSVVEAIRPTLGGSIAFSAAFNLAVFVSGAALALLFPGLFAGVIEKGVGAPLMTGLIGFAVFLMAPLSAFLLMFTVVGTLLAVALLVGFLLLNILAFVATGFVVGHLILGRDGGGQPKILFFLLGLLVLLIVGLIPIAGGVLVFLAYLIGFGAIVRAFLAALRQGAPS